jgi:hypothetical protein
MVLNCSQKTQLLLYYYATKSVNCNPNCVRSHGNIGANYQTCRSLNMCVILAGIRTGVV